MADANKEQNQEQKQNNENNNKKPYPKFNIYWVYALIAIFFISLNFMNLGGNPKETSWQEFQRTMLQNQDVKKIVVVNKEKAEVYLKDEALNKPEYQELFK